MEGKISQKVMDIEPSGIRIISNASAKLKNVISLSVGEPDFATPSHIIDKGVEALFKGETNYTPNAGLLELRNAISKRYYQKYNPETEIMITVGGSEAIFLSLQALVNPEDEVIYLEPGFVSYLPCIKLANGVPIAIQLSEKNGFRLQPEQLESAITSKTKVLILSYPHNPSGAIMEKADLERLLPIIKKNDLIVLSDEIYSDITYEKKHFSIADLPEMKERTLVLNGFSKSFAMTGWRVGYALGNARIIEQMIKIHQYTVVCSTSISQFAGIQAMEHGQKDTNAMKGAYQKRKKYLYDKLIEMGMNCFEPEGAFYMFPNISKFGLSSQDFAMKLLQDEKIAVVPGVAFGQDWDSHIRISFAVSLEELEEAVVRISNFLSKYTDK
ncbi:pyridoxal phosphate-dependent aminotransferase [Enterococcus sp. DIV0187]|uniref:pyridoxal phosphate-dependent aminotransferase n=1 Tax=Enterococcus sp. DIV0187 TaxID=2774644 RepID=UPI003F2875BF